MDLRNGYKVIYEKAEDGVRTFYASKTGFFADAEIIAETAIGEYKLIYEKDGMFYGSTTGIPTEEDYCFEEFKAIFEDAESETEEEDPTPVAYYEDDSDFINYSDGIAGDDSDHGKWTTD